MLVNIHFPFVKEVDEYQDSSENQLALYDGSVVSLNIFLFFIF